MATTQTSIFGALYGTGTDSVNLNAGSMVGGFPIDVGSSSISIAAGTASLTLTTAAYAKRFIGVQPNAGLIVSMPAPVGSGATFTLGLGATVSGGNMSIDCKGSDSAAIFAGIAWQNKTGTGVTTTGTAANTNLVQLNGSTTGGIVGDLITITDAALHTWNLEIVGQFTGSASTPFSNH